jgi:hypothetical protein
VINFAPECTQVPRETGFVTVINLRQASDISTILFAWKPTKKTNIERKEKLIRDMITAGATAYVYSLCGYSMKPVELPVAPAPVRVLPEKYDVATRIESLSNNDRLPAAVKQLLIDSLVNEYISEQPKLEANKERWLGVAQKAEELGFKTDASNRVRLGRYASDSCEQLVRQREERLCNGQLRKIWVYLDNKQLEIVIRKFFAMETLY